MTNERLKNLIAILGDRLDTEFELSSWAPGDGWTRYQVIETHNGLHPGRPLCNRVYRAAELDAALSMAHAVLDYQAHVYREFLDTH